jgi:Cys-tRNA synthase (O-phospho-L-seryl-tRNA:Cys-tRNA synthase)
LCKKHKICFIVDAAQSAGILPMKLSDGINIICTAGHKGLYSPFIYAQLFLCSVFSMRVVYKCCTPSLHIYIQLFMHLVHVRLFR